MTDQKAPEHAPLNAIASKGPCYPRFENGRTETVFDVTVNHPSGRWAQIWVLRDQALAERVADALNASSDVKTTTFRQGPRDLAAKCQACGFANTSYDDDQHESWKFCPNCGTRLVNE